MRSGSGLEVPEHDRRWRSQPMSGSLHRVTSVEGLVRLYHDRLRERFGDRLVEVRLFGSYARGEANEHSDVDVLALVRALTFREKVEAVELAAELSLSRGLPLAPVVMDAAEFARLVALELGFAANVLAEGRLV
jgi:predicted nucleotidyltransferase